ncbi:hypothetical protein DXG01_014149, partial [Tephrocybe rancida]
MSDNNDNTSTASMTGSSAPPPPPGDALPPLPSGTTPQDTEMSDNPAGAAPVHPAPAVLPSIPVQQ